MPDPFVSNLIITGIVGLVSGVLGVVVTNAVQNEKISALQRRADKVDTHLQRHDTAFAERVLFKEDLREKCAGCARLDAEQHNNLLGKFQMIEAGIENFKRDTVTAFRNCTDDLIRQLRGEQA